MNHYYLLNTSKVICFSYLKDHYVVFKSICIVVIMRKGFLHMHVLYTILIMVIVKTQEYFVRPEIQ